ncbi:unnamed protein product, partial [Timema podura]|nr:unnamed protein product [Timema podura]
PGMEQFSSLSLSDGPASIEYTQPSIKMHSFSTEVGETRVQFQVLKMNNSIFLWIGSRTEPTFDDLSVAMNTKYDNLPVSSRLFGNTSDLTSSNLSMRLVKRLGKPVYRLENRGAYIMMSLNNLTQPFVVVHGMCRCWDRLFWKFRLFPFFI